MKQNSTRGLSKAAALKLARSHVQMYRQGRGWVLSQWNERMQMWDGGMGRELPYAEAVTYRREAIVELAERYTQQA